MTDTILIVDDERDLLLGLARTVAMELDCQVQTAENAAEAMEIIRSHPVDVVLTDIRMPGKDGMSLLQIIKEFDRAITVIMMTGHGTIE